MKDPQPERQILEVSQAKENIEAPENSPEGASKDETLISSQAEEIYNWTTGLPLVGLPYDI
jgi:hypothetical protein